MTLFLQLILFPLYGSALYRHRGAKYKYKKYLPRPFNQILFAAPYALLCTPPYVDSWWIAPVVLALATLGVLTGHGQYFLDLLIKKLKPETLDFILVPFFGKDPRTNGSPLTPYGVKKLYWRNVAGLSVTGAAITLPAGIALADPFIALSGAVKGPCYMLGQKIYDISPKVERFHLNDEGKPEYYMGISYLPQHLDVATELGEAFTGWALYMALAGRVVLGYI